MSRLRFAKRRPARLPPSARPVSLPPDGEPAVVANTELPPLSPPAVGDAPQAQTDGLRDCGRLLEDQSAVDVQPELPPGTPLASAGPSATVAEGDAIATVAAAEPSAPIPPGQEPRSSGPFAPLALPTYRMFWLASLFSNTGTWVHEIGAGWLMTTLDGSPQMVSAVRTVASLPIVLFAIPAGALSDRIDRRRLMFFVQCLMMVSTAALAWLTYMQWITPVGLLFLTFLMGIGVVIHVPTWQASIPEIVTRRHLPQAIALGSISFNLARSVGPAVGGLLIAGIGIWATFTVNALSFAVVLAAVACWRRTQVTPPPRESFLRSMADGVRLVTDRGPMQRVLLRVFLFVLPASSLWALMPLVVRQQLNWDARGYGYMVGAIGLGAVLAALWMPRLRSRIGVEWTLVAAIGCYVVGLAGLSLTGHWAVGLAVSLLVGVGWMAAMTTLNSCAQFALLDRMRARGMSCYLSALSVGMAVGGVVWGRVAEAWSTEVALGAAAGMMAIVALWIGWQRHDRLPTGDDWSAEVEP